jgi:hypothetical protein
MKRHPLTLAGAALTTITAVLFLFVFLMDMFGLHTNPYLGIVFFILLPTFFVIGLLMIPAGIILERRRVRKGLEPHRLPHIDLNIPRHRRVAIAVLSLTLVNVLIVSLAAFKGLEVMDSPEFCGQVCHTVMEPEFVAYKEGPHSRVRCVDCHIGPGASWFVKAKLDGTRQVIAVMRNSYSKPISTPVRELRPARDTCEQCHWPDKFHGDKAVVFREYGNDEQNSENKTQMLVHIGGGSERLGVASGIHWHMNGANSIEYVATDDKRQVIPYVRLKDPQGNIREFRAPGVTDDQIAKGERRTMDCMDCHNRPSHPFSASPERAVDGAIARGEIPKTLPFARRQAVETLKVAYTDRTTAEKGIADALRGFYGQHYAPLVASRGGEVDQLVAAAQRLYARNVFPKMNVTWGTHINNLGHTDFPGCFRCHDDEHKTTDGRVIKQAGETCHELR